LRALGAQAKDVKVDLESLLTDSDPTVRASAAVALLIIGTDPQKCTAMLNVMLRSVENPVKQAATQALATSGPEARDLVLALADAVRDPDEMVRLYAAMALINITGEAEQYAPILVERLAGNNDFTRMWVARAVRSIAGRFPRVLEPLLLKTILHKDKVARLIALDLLRGLRMDPALAIQVYSRTLRDEDSEVRAAGLSALASMGAKASPALPNVREALGDPVKGVREAAREAVQRISNRDPE
jgi:HEAT repeat protein